MSDSKLVERISAIVTSSLAGAALVLCIAPSAFAGIDAPGRLFFTPTERDALDFARTWRLTCVSVNGLVIKNGEGHDFWADADFNDPRIHASVVARDDSRAEFVISLGSQRTIKLRSGQSLVISDDVIRDTFEIDRARCLNVAEK